MISAIVPTFNEEGSVALLHRGLVGALSALGKPFEIVLVDDGSTDGTYAEMVSLSPATVVRLRRNSGKAAAIDAGFAAAKGSIIVTIDADGQNDPADVPLLISQIEAGADAVVGWRARRNDPIGKLLVSRLGRLLRKSFLKSSIHDSVCGLQAYRREALDSALDLNGELYRFLPDMLAWQGYDVREAKIRHHPRKRGKSKFTSIRIARGFLDFLSVIFWRRYSSRPLHIFGGMGLFMIGLGSLVILTVFVLRILKIIFLAQSIWPLVGFFLVLAGIQLFVTGIVADIALRGYREARSRKTYSVRDISSR